MKWRMKFYYPALFPFLVVVWITLRQKWFVLLVVLAF
jgi:hypothetical protein